MLSCSPSLCAQIAAILLCGALAPLFAQSASPIISGAISQAASPPSLGVHDGGSLAGYLNSNLSDLDKFRLYRDPDLSSTVSGDHENAGLLAKRNDPPSERVPGSALYVGVYANHIVYLPSEIHLHPPPGAGKPQTLFAATTRPPNGSCLEVGTSYTTAVGAQATNAALYVYDFCKPGHPDWGIPPVNSNNVIPFPIDDNFIKKYAGATVGGKRAYTVAIFTQQRPPITSSTVWVAQLYNYLSQSWDCLYQSKGYASFNLFGWSLFETWYQPGQCSEQLPLMGVGGLSYFNSTTLNWDSVQPSMADVDNIMTDGGKNNNNCFRDDARPASYAIAPMIASDHWQVQSR